MTALIPIVLAWLNTVLPSTPSRRAPSTTAAAGRSRSLGTFVTSIRPSLIETTSVNVPPTSTPSMSIALLRPARQLCSPSGVYEP